MSVHHEIIKNNYTVRYVGNLPRSVPHWHQRMEFLLVERGSYCVTVMGEDYIGSPGDVFVIRSGQIHYIRSNDPDPAMYICTFNPALLYLSQTSLSFISNYIPRNALENAGLSKELFGLFSQLLEEEKQGRRYADLMNQARIQMLYGMLARHFEEASGLPRALAKLEDFQTVLSYISENYHEPINLETIARQLNYNASYVSSMFVTYTGVNYKLYLDSIRISEASKLLLGTKHSISHISTLCGFENIRTFNNVFRRITGTTPSQFRKQL